MHVNMQGDGTRNLEFYAMLSQEVCGTERKPDVVKTLHLSDISPGKLCVQTCVIMPRIEVFFFEMFCFVKIRLLLREVQTVFCLESAEFLNF
jgi:hypothetical protein